MKLGVLTYEGIDERIAIAKSLGVTGIGLKNEDYLEGDVSKAIDKAAAAGLDFAQVTGWDFNPLRPTSEGEAVVKSAIAAAARIDSRPSVIFGAGGYHEEMPFFPHPDNWKPEALELAAKNIKPLAQIAEDSGISLALEPHYAVVARDEIAIRALHDKIGSPAVGFDVDIVNMIKIGDFWQTEVAIDRFLDSVGDICVAAHLKDLSIEDKLHLHLNECPAGQGNLNYPHFLKKLDETLSSETYALVEHTPAEQLPETMQFVRDQAAAAGVTFNS